MSTSEVLLAAWSPLAAAAANPPSEGLTAADVAQIAGAAFTALAAGAAWLTVRHADSQNKTARETLDAQTQPLLADLPWGVFRERDESIPANMRMRGDEWRDEAEISVGVYSSSRNHDRPSYGASVAIRNVGNGTARVRQVHFIPRPFVIGEDADAIEASASNPVIPPREFTRVGFMIEEDDERAALAESISAAYSDFDVRISYDDASGRPRGELRLQVANGQHPRVVNREWSDPSLDGR